jgi:hypothetical protein
MRGGIRPRSDALGAAHDRYEEIFDAYVVAIRVDLSPERFRTAGKPVRISAKAGRVAREGRRHLSTGLDNCSSTCSARASDIAVTIDFLTPAYPRFRESLSPAARLPRCLTFGSNVSALIRSTAPRFDEQPEQYARQTGFASE